MDEEVLSWDEFISYHLLRPGLVSGAILMSPKGAVSYRYGSLQNTDQDELHQFLHLFEGSLDETGANQVAESGFRLFLSGHMTNFKIYKKTHCSIHSTSGGGRSGLIVCNLPYGVLLCVYRHPVTSSRATTAIEAFCDRLRQ